jgi:hypothetical protein
MPAPIVLISESLLLVLQVWRELQRQRGYTEAQIDQAFDETYPEFMAASKDPVEPPTED